MLSSVGLTLPTDVNGLLLKCRPPAKRPLGGSGAGMMAGSLLGVEQWLSRVASSSTTLLTRRGRPEGRVHAGRTPRRLLTRCLLAGTPSLFPRTSWCLSNIAPRALGALHRRRSAAAAYRQRWSTPLSMGFGT